MYFGNLTGLLLLIGSLLLMCLTVPWPGIKKFALFGLVSGLGIAVVLIFIMQNWFGFWIFHHIDLLYVGGIPLILAAAWAPVEILFAHFLSRNQYSLVSLLLIFAIPVVSVGIHFIQIKNHLLDYHHWNYQLTFLVSLGIHLGLAFYLNRVKVNNMNNK